MAEYNTRKDKIEIFVMKLKIKIRRILKTKTGSFIWQIVSSLLILAVSGGIGVFAAFAQTQGSARVYAKDYFKYFMTHSWSLMYKETNLVPSKFVNEDTFGEMMSIIVPARGSDKYKFVDRGTDGQYHLIDVVYQETGSEAKRTMTLRMKKMEEKTAFILDQWEVSLEEELIRNCTITAPSYLSVKLDGVSLSDCPYEDSEETGLRTYTVDLTLAGAHKLELSTYGTNTVSEIFLWDNSRQNYTVEATEFPLDNATTAFCSDTAIDMVVGMFTGALTNVGCDSVKAFLTTDEQKADLDAVYNNLVASISRDDGATLVSMSFDSYNTVIAEYVPAKSLAVDFFYETTFSAKGGRAEMGGVRESYQGKTNGAAIVRFECHDGTWSPVKVEMGCFDYSKQETPQ